jgi:hypothetical protein
MKATAFVVLMLSLVAVTAQAQEKSVRVTMKSSGDSLATTIDLQADTITDVETQAGDGNLGAFTFHGLRADGTAPAPASCASGLYFPVTGGAGVFRFDDGSLFVVNVTGGGGCIDPTAGTAQLIETYQIAPGGTGRFERATGTLSLTGTLMPVTFNTAGNPQLLTLTGKFEGTVSGVRHGYDHPGPQ